MKRFITNTVIVTILFIIDNTLMPFLSIHGYYPSLLFIFVLCYAIINERWYAFGMGIISGFLQDIYFFNGIGINLFTNMILCVIAGEIGRSLFKQKIFMPVVSIFGLIILKGLVVYEILKIVGLYSSFYNVIFNAIYSLFIAVIMYKVVFGLYQKRYMMKNWRF